VEASAPQPGISNTVEENTAPRRTSTLLAQVDVAPLADAFAVPAAASPQVLAAVTTAQAQAAEPEADIPGMVLRMTEEISALKRDQLSVIEEWNDDAMACEARKQGSLFGTFSEPCREVRVVQIRGDVFRFVYACHVLGVQQAALWAAWRQDVQQQAGTSGVEESLLANEQELAALCSRTPYDNQYPGFNAMLADAEALKYYNPWRRPSNAPAYQWSYPSDPLYLSRLSDPPF
jgi:hypothetical protein